MADADDWGACLVDNIRQTPHPRGGFVVMVSVCRHFDDRTENSPRVAQGETSSCNRRDDESSECCEDAALGEGGWRGC